MSAPLAPSFATNVHTAVETHTQQSALATTQSAVSTSAPSAKSRRKPLGRRISKEASGMLRDYYDNHNDYPTRGEREHLLQKVEGIDGLGTYDLNKLNNWFSNRRKYSPRVDNTVEKKGTAELFYPSLTQANMEAINLCLEETCYPNDAHLDIWAKRLDVNREHLSMYVSQYRADHNGAYNPRRRRSMKPAATAAATAVDDSTRAHRDTVPTPATQPPPPPPLEISYPTPTSSTFPSPAVPNEPIRAPATWVATPMLVFLPQPHGFSPAPPTANQPTAPALLPPPQPVLTPVPRPVLHTRPKELLIDAVRAAQEAARAMPPPPIPMMLHDLRRALEPVEETGARFLAAVRSGELASYGIIPEMAQGRRN
ncbi:hypothetical protein FA95DRAFT_1594919 [Auriscalpium vulgare]|uniref:Uncharacterized protein n=1 Tax=Auriscalpium vulgare TaxID=40419 RepID=A0ACB8RYZ8_9AGAM|nr:hypothetical protein FA95DRAFT_1594919 [Auriscalpium vulgare]